MEQRALNFCARVLLVCKYGPWQYVSVTLPALLLSIDTCLRILNCRQCAIGLNDSEKRIQAFETKCMRKLLLSPTSSRDQRPGVEQDQLPCGSTGTSSGNYQETETCMVRACHTPRQPLQHPSFRTSWRLGNAVFGRGNAGVDNIKEWTSLPIPELPTRAWCRKDWKRIAAESSLMSPRRPSRSRE